MALAVACVREHPNEVNIHYGSFLEPLLALLDPNESPIIREVLKNEFGKYLSDHNYLGASPMEKLLIERIAV